MRYALISEATNEVVNIIELEPEALWEAPQGCFIRFDENAKIGMFWNGSEIVEQIEN